MGAQSPCQLQLWDGSTGDLELSWTAGAQEADCQTWVLRLQAGSHGFQGACSVALDLPNSAEEPWFLFPGFFIGQGRAVAGAQRWPCLGAELQPEQYTAPSWDFALDRGAYPVLLARQDGHWRGLSWQPHYQLHDCAETASHWGDSEPQIGCGLSWSKNEGGQLRLNLPANEGPRRHARNRHDSATDRQLRLPAGASIEWELRVWDFAGDHRAYGPVLRRVYEELAAAHPAAELPQPECIADAACAGLLNWHWIDDPGYFVYTTAYDRTAEFNANMKKVTLGWHFEALGFVGGFPVAFGLLWRARQSGDKRAEEVALRCLERWCREGVSDWGFFRTSYHPGKARTANGDLANPAGLGVANDDPSGDTPFYGSCWLGNQRLIHARTTADASLYLARCLQLLGDGHEQFENWRRVLRRNLEAACEVQDEQGRFGQHYDLVERCVARSEGSGGLLWIPAFYQARALFTDDPDFVVRIDEALRLAGRGYAADVEAGWITGAPEDVDLAPTSEDGYNAVMAYAALHRQFGDDEYLQLLRLSADWLLAWRKSYNVRFPKRNVLGAYDFRTVGGDFASSHNNHLHVYGCNCIADMHYLSQQLQDTYYGKRADEHLAYTAQLLCLEDGQWNGQRGMCCEQYYTSDWSIWGDWDPTEHHVQKGTFMGFSHVWCINMLLLGLEQLQQAES